MSTNLPIKRSIFELFMPNMLVTARYDYSAVAKNVLYLILDEIQKYQRKEKEPHLDLFGCPEITIDISKAAKGRHPDYVRNVIREELMSRIISFQYINKEGKIVKIDTTLIPSLRRIENSPLFTFTLVKESIIALLWLGRGFTALSYTEAMTLPSMYSKRVYEFCRRFDDKFYYVVRIDEFRRMLYIENKFKQIVDLRNKVLDRAVQDINTTSKEIEIEYTLLAESIPQGERKRGKLKFDRIMFFIYNKSMGQINPKGKHFREFKYVYDTLKIVFPYFDGIVKLCDWLLNNDRIIVAADRCKRLQADISSGRINKKGVHNYTLSFLPEFGIPTELLPLKKEKTKLKKGIKKSF